MDDNSDDPRYGQSGEESSIEEVRHGLRGRDEDGGGKYATGSDIRDGAASRHNGNGVVDPSNGRQAGPVTMIWSE